MRKLYTLILTTFLLLAFSATALAGPDYWAHANYNLSKVKNINIIEIDERNDSNEENFYPDSSSTDMVKTALYRAAGKEKINICEVEPELPETEPRTKSPQTATFTPTEVNLKIIINNIGYLKITEPAHYETVERTITRTITKSDGTYTTISEPVTEQKYVPAQNYYYGKADITYQLYDTQTQRMIFNSRDNRLRSYTYDPSSMVDRSAKDFLKNMRRVK